MFLTLGHLSCKEEPTTQILCCTNIKGTEDVLSRLRPDDVVDVDAELGTMCFSDRAMESLRDVSGTIGEYFKVMKGDELIGYIEVVNAASSNRSQVPEGTPYVVYSDSTRSIAIKGCMKIVANGSVEMENRNKILMALRGK